MSFIKALGWTVAAGTVFALSGCGSAPIPLAQNFELTSQYKVRSAGHWELLSRDVVAQTRVTLEKAGYAPSTPLHVAAPPQSSAFDLGFRDFLITELVQGGATVQQNPGAVLEVTYNTQVVRHNSDRPHFIPGQFTMLAAGVMAAYGLRHEHLDTQLLATLGLTWAQAAAMGDDWPDLPVMRRCALACAPANAHAEVQASAHHVTQARGGDGAAREFCDLLLMASGRYAGLLEAYCT